MKTVVARNKIPCDGITACDDDDGTSEVLDSTADDDDSGNEDDGKRNDISLAL